MVSTILVALEDSGRRQHISKILNNKGYRVIEASSGYHSLDLLRRRPNIVLALLDLKMSDINGMDFIDTLRSTGVRVPIIIITTNDDERDLSRAIDSGANDFINFPCSDIRLIVTIKNTMQKALAEREIKNMHRCFDGNLHFSDLIANSLAMQTTVMVAKDIVEDNSNVLITGEQGTGRKSIAKFIHRESINKNNKIHQIQCRTTLNTDELTAEWKKNVERTVFNSSNETLIFNNIENLSYDLQDFLYNQLIKLNDDNNVRLIATTTSAIDEILKDGLFHQKLYNIFAQRHLAIPPLRSRREDISQIAKTLLVRIVAETGYTNISGISNSAIVFLSQYNWPDNILELDRLLFRAVLISSGPLLTIADFPQLVKGDVSEIDRIEANTRENLETTFFDKNGHIFTIETVERDLIQAAMKRYNGRISEVARRLKIGRSTLYRKLVELEIDT